MKFGNIGIHKKKRIFQVKIIFKQKMEIAGHFSVLSKSKKIFLASKYFLNGEKRDSRYWAYDLVSNSDGGVNSQLQTGLKLHMFE